MRTGSQLFFTFLLNALWMVTVVAAAASLAAYLLRDTSARYRHWIWTAALLFSILIPTIATVNDAAFYQPANSVMTKYQPSPAIGNGQQFTNTLPLTLSPPTESISSGYRLNQYVALAVLLVYLSFLVLSVIRLAKAWAATEKLKAQATFVEGSALIQHVVHKCAQTFRTPTRAVVVLSSNSINVPVTIGLFHPVIILPRQLFDEGNIELLTSAIGHEFIHVARRDYVLNLIYELLFIPLSFHPAAALIRSRIRQTRELCCDELVAERILKPEIYARSLVQLASCAPPFGRLSISTTVGIADADILEARIMSLLRKPKLSARWKRISLIATSLLLVLPCFAAAALAMHFEVQPSGALFVQDPQEKEKEEKEKQEKLKVKEERERQKIESREGWVSDEKEPPRVYFTVDSEERERRQQEELKVRTMQQAALVKLARVQMDQAIQIATSQQPGKVLECTLNGEHWEEPGKLAKDGYVFYHVVIMSGDEPNQVLTHVLVNALDGSVIKSEKELPRKMRREEP